MTYALSWQGLPFGRFYSVMDQDQRLTPLPRGLDMTQPQGEYPASYAGFHDDESLANKRTIRQYFNIIYKRWPIILAMVVIATIAAAIYQFRQPSVYQASADLLIEPRKPRPTDKDSININLGTDETTYYNTQLQLLQNPELMKKVVVSLGLQRTPDLFGNEDRGIVATIRNMFGGSKPVAPTDNALPILTDDPANDDTAKMQLTPEENTRAENYAGILSGGLSVDQTERTSIFRITQKSSNPVVSAKVADKVAALFIEEDRKRELTGIQTKYDELTKAIEDLNVTIAKQENDLADYMRSSNLPLQEKGSDLAASRLQTISEQYLTAQDDRRKLEARYNAAQQASQRGEGQNIPDLYDNKVYQDTVRLNTERRAKLQDQIRDIEKQIKEAQTERAELLVKYTEEYPKVKQVDERIRTLQQTRDQTEKDVSQIIDRDQKKIEKDAVGGALVGLRSQLNAAVVRENQLLNSYEQESARANIQGQAETKLTTDKRGLETNRKLLDTYTQWQQEALLAKSSEAPSNMKISNHAATPGAPSGPPRTRNILITMMLALGAGIGLAFLLDYLDDSVRTSDDISRHLGLPTLGLIPHYSIGDRRRASIAGSDNSLAVTASSSSVLISLEDQRSPMAEAYRHLRTSLLFSSAGKPPQSILITSSQPSEGKTTTAINTAITLAQSNADVVLIDCDLRRPRLHSHFGLTNTEGLTNYLSGDRSPDNMIKGVADLPRLKVITSGPIPPNPAELLSSNEMRNLLQFLRGRFKHIIIDSPPAISFTDAAILSTQADGVVLVAMAGKSSIHLMRQFRSRLAAIGARIYGVVLNGITAGSMEYDYYGSGYYNYYGKADTDDSTPSMAEQQESAAHVTKN